MKAQTLIDRYTPKPRVKRRAFADLFRNPRRNKYKSSMELFAALSNRVEEEHGALYDKLFDTLKVIDTKIEGWEAICEAGALGAAVYEILCRSHGTDEEMMKEIRDLYVVEKQVNGSLFLPRD